jgi:hypothetical protein
MRLAANVWSQPGVSNSANSSSPANNAKARTPYPPTPHPLCLRKSSCETVKLRSEVNLNRINRIRATAAAVHRNTEIVKL